MITRGEYFIDLVGINYDEVQNVPINGKAPAERDGTGNVGEMKAKVVIRGDSNTSYSVEIRVEPDTMLELVGAPTSLTTNESGDAEQEFVMRALGTQPSALEDVMLTALLFSVPDEPAAWTTEFISVYKFYFHADGGPASPDAVGDEHEIYEDPSSDYIEASHITSTLGARSAAAISRKYNLSVRTEPASAWSGEVAARVYLRVEDVCVTVTIAKTYPPMTHTPPLGITWKILTIEIPGIPLGEKAGGFGGGDIGVILAGEQSQSGDADLYLDAKDVPAPPAPGRLRIETHELDLPSLHKKDYSPPDRIYVVDAVYPDLIATVGVVGCQVVVSHVEWTEDTEGRYYLGNGVDVRCCAMDWGLDPSGGPWSRGLVTVREDDDVFEMQ